jgi:hypothetical protein
MAPAMKWGKLAHGCLLAVALAGCRAPGPNLRTPVPETFAIPPEDDPRYSKPLEYPKELLNRPPVKPTSPQGIQGMKGGAGGAGNAMPGAAF